MKAILISYACDQNEPSKPVSKLYDVPADTNQRDRELKDLFNKHVCLMHEEDGELTIREIEDPYGYCDIEVASEDGDMFLFVTFVDE